MSGRRQAKPSDKASIPPPPQNQASTTLPTSSSSIGSSFPAPPDQSAVLSSMDTVCEDSLACSLEELTRPIGDVKEKWKLLPHFLRMRGLMKQHIDSFNHFVNVDIKQIVAAKSNCEVRSENESKFFLRYTNIYVGDPTLEEDSFLQNSKGQQ